VPADRLVARSYRRAVKHRDRLQALWLARPSD